MEVIFRLVQLKQKMSHQRCLGLKLGYLLINGCFELSASWRTDGSFLVLSDRPVLMVGLSRIYRITWHLGEQCIGGWVSQLNRRRPSKILFQFKAQTWTEGNLAPWKLFFGRMAGVHIGFVAQSSHWGKGNLSFAAHRVCCVFYRGVYGLPEGERSTFFLCLLDGLSGHFGVHTVKSQRPSELDNGQKLPENAGNANAFSFLTVTQLFVSGLSLFAVGFLHLLKTAHASVGEHCLFICARSCNLIK